MSVYKIVTEKIIEKLESGVVPWRKPWQSAVSWESQKPYRGINTMLLDSGEYATFNQIKKAGGKVKKGAKSHMVVFWKWLDVEEGGEEKRIPFLRYYKVFEINTQCEGLKSRRKDKPADHNPIKEAEKIKEGYRDCPPITFAPGGAFYIPSKDIISLPPISEFYKTEGYYSTMFHEIIHSTGHAKRLNREGITAKASFGSEIYSREELVAEIGAAMLCGVCGIDNTIDNSASYIQSWINALKGDHRLVVHAAAQAQKAADYVQGISY